VALSIALAAVIVAPSAWRASVAIGVSATHLWSGWRWSWAGGTGPLTSIAATFVCLVWAAAGLLTAALVRGRAPVVAGNVSGHVGALLGASIVGGLLVSVGVRPQPGLRDLGLGIVSLGSIGLACAVSVAVVAHLANRHLG